MIGILILSHGEMANGMRHSLNFLFGQAEGLRALCLYPEHSPANFDAMLAEAIAEVDGGEGVLIFTDIAGGTPANRAMLLAASRPDVEVVTGMNLPLLLAAVSSREVCALPELGGRCRPRNGAHPEILCRGCGCKSGLCPMAGIHQLHLPVTAFRFCGLDFVSIPGELFSALQPKDVSIIGYANGYYRYIGGEPAYEAAFYEALPGVRASG